MKKEFDELIAPVLEAVDRFDWKDKACYAEYLAQTYFYVRHSTRLLGMGAGMFDETEDLFHERFLKHAAEEKGHHKLALNDLKALGQDIKGFKELPATSFLYQPQYYLISHRNPLAFFGYILALEGLSDLRAGQMHQWAEEFHGKGTGIFLKVHEAADEGHSAEAFEMIEKVDAKSREAILENLRGSCQALIYFFKEIELEAHRKEQALKAA